jgi:hypothetical protein
LLTTSAIPAGIRLFDNSKLLLNQTNDYLDESNRNSLLWHDFFDDSSKIDADPPGDGATDNYIIENGYVKMKNTYPVWTDPQWTKMKPIQITNTLGQTQNYIIQLTVNYESDMKPDYGDIRFKHADLPDTWLDYWIESYDETSTEVWVLIPLLPSGISTMYLFYGNPFAVSQSNFDNVFDWEYKWGGDQQITYTPSLQGAWDPKVAYGNNRFLVAWEEGRPFYPIFHEIRANMFDINGNILINNFLIYKDTGALQYRNENPSIAFGDGKFFVAWERFGTGSAVLDRTSMDIYGRIVHLNGNLGPVIQICTASYCQADPNVAFDSVNNRFCVVWEDARSDMNNYGVYGRLYDSNGNPVGSEKAIAVGPNNQVEPWVAFNPIHEQYMIVWEDGIQADVGPFSLKAGIFDKDLNQIGSTITIATGHSNLDHVFPCVEFNPESQRYLITWNTANIGGGVWHGDVWGRILDHAGNTIVNNFIIRQGNFVRTDVVNYLGSSFFVSFDGNNKVWGKMVLSDGGVVPYDVQLSSGSSADAIWAKMAVAEEKIFVTWEDKRSSSSSYPDVYGNIWHLNIPSGSGVTAVFGTEKEIVLTTYITSIKIQPNDLSYWDKFIEISEGIGIVFDILHGETGMLILPSVSNGSSLTGLTTDSIRLMATFTRPNPATTPMLDMWGVSYYKNEPPYIPSNPSPANGAVNVNIDAVLSWSGGDPDPGDIVTYDVYFGVDSPPVLVSTGQMETYYDPGLMSHDTMYYWKIVAFDNHGASTEGPIWNFKTQEVFNNPPNTPTISGQGSFIPGVEFVQPNVEYSFTVITSDSDGDDVYYWVDWGDDSNTGWLGPFPTSYGQTVNHTWTQPISLKFVRVKAMDIHGAESGWGYLVVIVNVNTQSTPFSNQVLLKQRTIQNINQASLMNIKQNIQSNIYS